MTPHQPILESRRLTLRTLTESDCNETYLAWLNDPAISRFLETRHTRQTLESIRAFVAQINASPVEFLFAICLKAENGRHIGNIKVGPIRPHHLLADVSLLIGARDCWGKGYATEAITALSRHAFAVLGVQKLQAGMYADNVGSARAFLAAGYRQEGLRRRHYRLDNTMSDVIELGALPEDLA